MYGFFTPRPCCATGPYTSDRGMFRLIPLPGSAAESTGAIIVVISFSVMVVATKGYSIDLRIVVFSAVQASFLLMLPARILSLQIMDFPAIP